MPGTMSQADLIMDLKGSLRDSVAIFSAANDADFARHLSAAALAFQNNKSRPVYGEIALVAGTRGYAIPANFGDLSYDTWGQVRKKPWETGYSGRLPHNYPFRENADAIELLKRWLGPRWRGRLVLVANADPITHESWQADGNGNWRRID